MATVLRGDKLGTKEEKRASEMRQNEHRGVGRADGAGPCDHGS